MRGNETITVKARDVELDWQGDPVAGGEQEPARVITGAQLVPVVTRDDNTIVPDVYDVYLWPPVQPPRVDDTIQARGEDWDIDGSIAAYDRGGVVKAYQFRIKRLAAQGRA